MLGMSSGSAKQLGRKQRPNNMNSGADETATSKVLRGASARARRVTKAHLLKVSVPLFLIFGTYVLLQWLDVEQLLNPARIATHLRAAGPLAPLLFMLLMAAAVVISSLPSLPLDLAAEAAFGTVLGTTYTVIGAILSFLIGRALDGKP